MAKLKSPLAYLGVPPQEPPEVVVINRAPNQGDRNFRIGAVWIVKNADEIYQLSRLQGGVATWVQTFPSGGGGAQTFITGNGVAVPDANGDITVLGGLGLTSEATGANEVTVRPTALAVGTVFLSGVGFGLVASPNNTITVTFTPGGLDLDVNAANLGAVTRSIDTDAGQAAPNNGNIDILGGQNIETEATAGNEITVRTTDFLNLPNTTGNAVGVYRINNARFMHKFGGADNTFLGPIAGNFALTGNQNTMIGAESGNALTDGASNSALGRAALSVIQGGSHNVALGVNAGQNYTGNENSNVLISNDGVLGESNVIRIGTQGAGNRQQNRFYAVGIHGVTQNNLNDLQYVTVNPDGQLGSTDYPNNQNEGIAADRVDIFAYLPADIAVPENQPFDPTNQATYTPFGSTVAFTEIRDRSNSLFPGDGNGNELVFTAPRDGQYSFTVEATARLTPLFNAANNEYEATHPSVFTNKNGLQSLDMLGNFGRNERIYTAPTADGVQRALEQGSPGAIMQQGQTLQAGDTVRFLVNSTTTVNANNTFYGLAGGQPPTPNFTTNSIYNTILIIKENWSTGYQ